MGEGHLLVAGGQGWMECGRCWLMEDAGFWGVGKVIHGAVFNESLECVSIAGNRFTPCRSQMKRFIVVYH